MGNNLKNKRAMIIDLSIEYDEKEVSKHNKIGDAWVVIDDNVYDITDFIDHHPGGKDFLIKLMGKNATVPYRKGASHDDRFILSYKIGKYSSSSKEKIIHKFGNNMTPDQLLDLDFLKDQVEKLFFQYKKWFEIEKSLLPRFSSSLKKVSKKIKLVPEVIYNKNDQYVLIFENSIYLLINPKKECSTNPEDELLKYYNVSVREMKKAKKGEIYFDISCLFDDDDKQPFIFYFDNKLYNIENVYYIFYLECESL